MAPELAPDASLGSTMILRSHRFFLILLVLSTPVDDIVAAGTPDPDDDIFATENNNYVPAGREVRGKAMAGEERPLLYRLDVPTSSPSVASPAIFGLPDASRFPWLSTNPLYFFMSLLC